MRIIILTAVVLASLGTTLYQVKTGIDERQAELRRLQAEIATTQRDIAVLEAEWAFLSRPDRVMNLSASLLGYGTDQPRSHSAAGSHSHASSG